LYSGTSYILGVTGTDVWVDVPGSFPSAYYVEFTWTDSTGASRPAGFMVRGTPTVVGGITRIVLWGNDVTPNFTGDDADGSVDRAYNTAINFFPQHELGAAGFTAGGFGVPAAGAMVHVHPPGANYATGISPTVPHATTGLGDYFAGRTVVFAQAVALGRGLGPDFNQTIIEDVVHEFVHAFGMPHKCGQWDWRTPREKSCCMNYWDTWLIDSASHLIPGSDDKQGAHMCGRHLMEVRRVHLERNRGLNW
jgi:hypothetical protein